MEAIPFSAGTIEKIGIVLKITYKKEGEITLDDMKEITHLRKELFGEHHYASLIDLKDDNLEFQNDALKYVTDNEVIRNLRVAEVLLVKSFAQRLGIHSYVKIFRSKDNVTVMTDEENALHWLNRQYQKQCGELVDSE